MKGKTWEHSRNIAVALTTQIAESVSWEQEYAERATSDAARWTSEIHMAEVGQMSARSIANRASAHLAVCVVALMQTKEHLCQVKVNVISVREMQRAPNRKEEEIADEEKKCFASTRAACLEVIHECALADRDNTDRVRPQEV